MTKVTIDLSHLDEKTIEYIDNKIARAVRKREDEIIDNAAFKLRVDYQLTFPQIVEFIKEVTGSPYTTDRIKKRIYQFADRKVNDWHKWERQNKVYRNNFKT